MANGLGKQVRATNSARVAVGDFQDLPGEDDIDIKNIRICRLQFEQGPIKAQCNPYQAVILLDVIAAIRIENTACAVGGWADRWSTH